MTPPPFVYKKFPAAGGGAAASAGTKKGAPRGRALASFPFAASAAPQLAKLSAPLPIATKEYGEIISPPPTTPSIIMPLR